MVFDRLLQLRQEQALIRHSSGISDDIAANAHRHGRVGSASLAKRTAPPIRVTGALLVATMFTACSFFQMTPASGEPPAKKPATAPPAGAAKQPATKSPPADAAKKPDATVPKNVVADSTAAAKRAAGKASEDSAKRAFAISSAEKAANDSVKRAASRATADSTKRMSAIASAARASADSAKRVQARVRSDSIKRVNDAAAEARRAEKAAAKTAPVEVPLSVPPIARRPEPVIQDPPSVEPPPAGSDSTGVARLLRAAALWDAIRLYHPDVAMQEAAWNNATVRRITEVRAAKSPEQYGRALQDWVGTLRDPNTRVEQATTRRNGNPRESTPSGVTTTVSQIVAPSVRGKKALPTPKDSTIVVTWPAGAQANSESAWKAMRDATQPLQRSMRVVLDLQNMAPAGDNAVASATVVREGELAVANNLATFAAAGPSVRRRAYEGWPDERGVAGSGFGRALWRVSEPLANVAGTGVQFASLRRIVIIAGEQTQVPASLLALVSSGQATLVASGTLRDETLVPFAEIDLGDAYVARVRVGELLNSNGTTGIHADTIVPAASGTDSAPGLKAALQIARGALNPRAPRLLTSNDDARMVNENINEQHYPIMGARLLSAFRLWGTLRSFHAYADQADENIDDALTRLLPRFEAARDADSYSAAVLDLATAMDDAQGVVTGPSVAQHIGAASAPFRVRWIEGRAIVTSLVNETEARAANISVGDEISAADGFPMAAYVSEHRRYGPSSNDWTRLRNTMDMVPRGPAGDASFRVRDANSRERALTLARSTANNTTSGALERANTAAVRELAGGIGYIDLDRLTLEQVASAFQTLGATRALVIDARTSQPASTQLTTQLLQRLATRPSALADKQAIRVATGPCAPATNGAVISCLSERQLFDDVLSADTARRYRGRTVMLIDERTQGNLEQLALALESAGNTVLIGSASAGTAGPVTALKLPGQLTATFSGAELRHSDGRQLQRVGLTPQVDAQPTVKGVRAGLDEVLESAQKWLVQQLDPAVKRKK